MAVMNTRNKIMKNILNSLQKLLPEIKFVVSPTFYWSPQTSTIYFDSAVLDSENGNWSLLHETGHAVLDHKDYKTDANQNE